MTIIAVLAHAGWSGANPAPRLPLTVKPLEGQGGPTATARVQQLLQRVSPFQIGGSPTPGSPIATGQTGAGFLEGQLMAGDGRRLFQRKYQRGSLELDARQFVDDIIFTLTKRPGIATSQIAFSFSEPGKPYQIYLCDFDGGNVRQMSRTGVNVAPAIGPDGAKLVHVSLNPNGSGLLRYTDLTKDRVTAIKMAPAQRIEPAFSPDGEHLAVSMSEGPGPDTDLFLIKLPGGKPAPLTRTPVPETSPSWSPDSNRIVFAAAPAPGRSDLFIYDIRQKTTTPLPTGLAMAIDPAWSPDGSLIAFVSVSEGGQRTLCVRSLVSGQIRKLTAGSQPVWGADSRHLVFVTGSGLSMIEIDSGRISPVITGGGRAVDPSWTR